jgi:hypothetical protein
VKEQGKSGQVLFPASLRDCLTGTVPETVAKTSLTGTLRLRVAWRGLLRIFRRSWMHSTLAQEGASIENTPECGEAKQK